MHATIRRLRTTPGQAGEVARLIENEYLPMIENEDGFVSYTLVDLGEDVVASLGVFSSAELAGAANAKAQSWVSNRLGGLIASPLEASAGEVLVDHPAR